MTTTDLRGNTLVGTHPRWQSHFYEGFIGYEGL